MSTLLRRGWLPLSAVAALTAVGVASATATSPASGTILLGPLQNRTEVQVGSKIVVEGRRQAQFLGTIGQTIIVGEERRVRHASGRLKWTITFVDAPMMVDAPGCPTFPILTLTLVGKVKAGETVLHGHFRGRSETGDVRVAGEWTITGVGPGVGGQPLFLPGSGASTYSGTIACKTVGPGGGDDDEDDGDDDDDD